MHINQPFGVNGDYYRANGINVLGHTGIDFMAVTGQPVYATHDGEVVFAGEDGANGLLCVIRTLQQFDYAPDKEDGQSYYKTLYGHLNKGSFKVKAGDIVRVGQQIAEADNTGLSTGSHLHFGLKPVLAGEKDWEWFNIEQNNGYLGAIDPTPYFGDLLDDFFFYDDMKFGQRGANIKALQKRLKLSPDNQTGYFGWITLSAVFLYQLKNNIPPTGYVGPLTRASLNRQ